MVLVLGAAVRPSLRHERSQIGAVLHVDDLTWSRRGSHAAWCASGKALRFEKKIRQSLVWKIDSSSYKEKDKKIH